MKKTAMIFLCGLAVLSMMTGCSGSAGDSANENLGTVTLAEYKGVKVNVSVPEVTDEEVDLRVQSALRANPEEVEVDRAAAEGDVVNIDFKGIHEGEAFEGGSGEGQDLELGSSTMIDGFEDGIIGMKKGETKDLNLTFPEDYRESFLAGQEVVFEIKVNAVKEKKDAVLDDAFIQRISDYSTVAEYEDSIRSSLLKQKEDSANLQIQQSVLQSVLDNSQFKLSKNALSKRYNARLKQYEEQAKMYGMSLTQMAQANGMDVPALKESIYASVEDDARSQLALDTIATQEGITLTEEDKEEFAGLSGMTAEDAANMYGQETMDTMALNYKIMKFLADNAVNEAGEAPAEAAETEAAK